MNGLKLVNQNMPFIPEVLVRERIKTDGFRYSLATGNWGDQKKAHQVSCVTGVEPADIRFHLFIIASQQLSYWSRSQCKQSSLIAVGIDVDIDIYSIFISLLSTTNLTSVCPAVPPDGASVGLVKNLVFMAYIFFGSHFLPSSSSWQPFIQTGQVR